MLPTLINTILLPKQTEKVKPKNHKVKPLKQIGYCMHGLICSQKMWKFVNDLCEICISRKIIAVWCDAFLDCFCNKRIYANFNSRPYTYVIVSPIIQQFIFYITTVHCNDETQLGIAWKDRKLMITALFLAMSRTALSPWKDVFPVQSQSFFFGIQRSTSYRSFCSGNLFNGID